MHNRDRRKKESKLKRNVEVNTQRAIKNRQRELKRELTEPEKQEFRTMFEDSANRIEQSGKLDNVWNSPDPGSSESKTTRAIGYFSGVTIKNGKIVR